MLVELVGTVKFSSSWEAGGFWLHKKSVTDTFAFNFCAFNVDLLAYASCRRFLPFRKDSVYFTCCTSCTMFVLWNLSFNSEFVPEPMLLKWKFSWNLEVKMAHVQSSQTSPTKRGDDRLTEVVARWRIVYIWHLSIDFKTARDMTCSFVSYPQLSVADRIWTDAITRSLSQQHKPIKPQHCSKVRGQRFCNYF